MSKIKISAVVNTRNEEKNIEACLKSLNFADEIIVVDMGSEDKTKKLLRNILTKFLTTKKLAMLNQLVTLPLVKLKESGF